jgi:hypothetical protein
VAQRLPGEQTRASCEPALSFSASLHASMPLEFSLPAFRSERDLGVLEDRDRPVRGAFTANQRKPMTSRSTSDCCSEVRARSPTKLR